MKARSRNPKILDILMISACSMISACNAVDTNTTTASTSTTLTSDGQTEPAARIIFHHNNFSDLDDYNTNINNTVITSYRCLGDLVKTYYANGDDYSGSPTAMTLKNSNDILQPTVRPKFLKNVSVDLTKTYFPTIDANVFSSDQCSHRATENTPQPSSCADFDRVPYHLTGLTLASTTPTPSPTPTTNEYYHTGYYRVRDDWCASQGPIIQPDPEVTKEGVGGVSIDLDRTQLEAKEDLLMVVTYHALNENSGVGNWPATQAKVSTPTSTSPPPATAGTAHAINDRTILKVNLMGTGETLEMMMGVRQPRVWAYTNRASYPIFHKEVATLEDPFGSLRSEQVYLPISQNAFIDRIRIDRVRGSYHLFQVDLYRLGNRVE
jgi:hypothetical protein